MPTFQLGSGKTESPGPTIRVGGKVISGNRDVDIAIVFDTTGSMSDKIEALIRTCVSFVDEPAKHHLNPNFLVIAFGDIDACANHDKVEVVVPLTSDIEAIKKGLQTIPRNYGGSNDGESSLEAIDLALKQQYRQSAVKVMIHLTDEPALTSRFQPSQINNRLLQAETLFYAFTPHLSYFQEMARQNGGEWQEISASSRVNLDELFRNLAAKIAVAGDEYLKIGDHAKYLQLKSGK